MVVGLDIGLVTEIEYSLEELNIKDKKKIEDRLLSYIGGIYDYEIEKFYFKNQNIFIHYNTLDLYFTQKFKEYKLKSNKDYENNLELVLNY